ncbi:MAG TPA: metalloregulator ArsR/SmtB family transcription factor [Gemmatimonadales bacterium]
METAFTPSLGQLSRLFHALSDETRLRILEMLRSGEHCVCDLTGALEAQQSRLSFHLRTLKEAGLVTDRRAGRWSYYALRPEVLEAMEGALARYRTWCEPGEAVCCVRPNPAKGTGNREQETGNRS